MSSNEDKKIIKFPGPKKERKQDIPYRRVLGQEDKKTDNLIELNEVNPFSLDSRFRGNDSSMSKRKPVLVNTNKLADLNNVIANKQPADINVIAKTDRSFWNRSSLEKQGASSPGSPIEEKENLSTLTGQDGGSGKSGQPSYYVISSVACAVFLMLVGVSYFNVGKFGNSQNRVIATSNGMLIMPVKITNKVGDENNVAVYENENGNLTVNLMERNPDMETDPGSTEESESKMEKWQYRLNKQEKKVLHLITTGQRKLASIGRKPVMKDRFSMEALKSRYDVQWRRGQLSSVTLLEGEEPVKFPSMDKVVKEYKNIFPHHYTFVKGKNSSDQMEVYELRDRESKLVKQVVALRDEQSRLLSVYVVSD